MTLYTKEREFLLYIYLPHSGIKLALDEFMLNINIVQYHWYHLLNYSSKRKKEENYSWFCTSMNENVWL